MTTTEHTEASVDNCKHRRYGGRFANPRLSSDLDAFSVGAFEHDAHPVGFAGFAGRCFVRRGSDLDTSVLEGGHCPCKIVGL